MEAFNSLNAENDFIFTVLHMCCLYMIYLF